MPCRDARDNECGCVDNSPELEAIICALVNEIRENLSEKDFSDIIDDAEKHGQIEIWGFIQKHKVKDMERIKLAVSNRFSPHEIQLIIFMAEKGML